MSKPQVDILVDLDPAIYACGFAAQTTEYVLVAEDPQGSLREAHFIADAGQTAGEKMHLWMKSLPEGEHVIDKQRIITPEPIEHGLHILNRHLDAIYYAVKELPIVANQQLCFRGFLSGSDNFRNGIAKQAVYKGNRDPTLRPYHYDALRIHARKYWDTVVSRGCEADDLISIMAEQAAAQHRDTIVVSIDKDLDQIPGQHYNPDKKVFYYQDRDSALLYLYQQALSGDSTDNIPGCYRCGPVQAQRIIAEHTSEFEGIDLDAEKSIWKRVESEYIASLQRAGCHYEGEREAIEAALETARLVYIQRAPRELWNPPGIGHGVINEYE